MKLMKNITAEYRESIYIEIVELSREKVYIVKNSLDDKLYIKKILESKNYHVYKKMQELSIDNVPKIYEIIRQGDKLIAIEEYISGFSLKEILAERKIIPDSQVIQYILDLINIMEKLHSSRPAIIHKDIKPSNIMITNDGIVKLIDFDISRVHDSEKSTDTHILGTYGYAAPEQFGYNQTDIRTDIFSIGITMNMLLLGKLPTEELYQGPMSKIIAKCIHLDPDRRYQNLGELRRALLVIRKKNNIKDNRQVDDRLPGFRSNNIVFKTMGIIWYTFLFMLLIGIFDKESISKERISNIIFGLLLLSLTILYGGYRGISHRLFLIKSKNPLIKLLGYILYSLVLLIIFAMILPG